MSDIPAVLGVMAYGRAAARLGRASRAAVLSKEGASPRRILLETGYQRGPYGWGVETRGDVYMKPASVLGARPYGTLEEMADVHPDVERAYPGIGRELRVEVVPDNAWADRVAAARKSLALWASHGDTASGFYDRGNHLIAVRAQMPGETMNGYIDRADGTVTHEVQHYAQERDGLRPGGPRRHVDADDYREDGLEVDARNSAARRKLAPEERREMPRSMTQDVKPEDVHLDDKGGDTLEGFARWLESMPAARIDVPEERARLAAMEDQRRRDRVANMYADIRLHEFERQARARENHAQALAKRDAAFAAQRDALERVSAAARPGPADRARRERADFMKQLGADQQGTIYTNPVTGPVFIGVDGVARPASQSQMEDARRSRHLDDKGGDNFGAFRNFLASDDVPESIFGYPVVRDESQYTEKDLEFFRENPKAAGFYDLGDEEVDEDVPQQAAEGGKATETFDTPIPEELKARYDVWYAQLPKNLQYTGDYDLQGAWLERLGQPDKYEATQNGHLDDYGKKPNHITFSTGSKWHDPKVPERTGGEWRQAKDGSWDFYPGTGNKASDDELKAYFEKYEKGNRVHRRAVRQDALGGDAGSETAVSETPVSEALQNPGGPRIVINPQVFNDKRDALCVAFNEAFRLVMEENGFEPVSEPTEKQRKFFADTAYADDELQLRRTILARIATLDTSVSDPTDEQLEETAEMLGMVMEVGAPQNEWEQQAVQRLHDVVAKAREGRVQNEETPPPPQDNASAQADVGGAFTPSEVLLPKKPDDLWDAANRAVEAYRAHVGARPEDGALLPPVYSDDPEDYRRYVVDLGLYGQLPGSSYAAEARKRLAGAGAAAYNYLTRPGLRADDGRSVATIPEGSLLNLPAGFYAGAAASLSGMARALKAGSSDAVRVVRGPENLGTVMYGGSAADRLADRLGAMSRRFDARVVDAHPALGVAYAAGGLAPWFATRGATVPLMMASAMEAGRLGYDRAWMATGANPYDAASWWRTPTARAAGLGLVGMAPWGPWLRQGVQRARLAAAPVAERAIVPYSPLFAALAEAPGAPSGLAGVVDAAAGIGAFTAADLLWPVGGGKPLPPPR